jgi:hypothetical protein
MKDWVDYLHEMLKANKLEVLSGKGKISHDRMDRIVKEEMEKFIEQKRLK